MTEPNPDAEVDLSTALAIVKAGQAAAKLTPWAVLVVALVTGTVKDAIGLLATVAEWGQVQFFALILLVVGTWAAATMARRQAATLQDQAKVNAGMGHELIELRQQNRELREEVAQLKRLESVEPAPGAKLEKVGG